MNTKNEIEAEKLGQTADFLPSDGASCSPVRVALSRRKGWRMPENAVKVCRPGKWGNPFRTEQFRWTRPDVETEIEPRRRTDEECQAEAVASYENWLPSEVIAAAQRELRGKNLACWCPAGTPCHADVLLSLSNAELRDRSGSGTPTTPKPIK